MATLLREHGKNEQAASVIKGELTTLDCRYCHIGDHGAELIAAFLQEEKSLKTVHLYDCNIGPPGAQAIANVLKLNRTVELLNLLGNRIGPPGAEALSDALKHNVCLVWINVNSNNAPSERVDSIYNLVRIRNALLIPAAVRRVSLLLIAARRNISEAGILAIFPKELVKMIAMEVWATSRDPEWIQAVSQVDEERI